LGGPGVAQVDRQVGQFGVGGRLQVEHVRAAARPADRLDDGGTEAARAAGHQHSAGHVDTPPGTGAAASERRCSSGCRVNAPPAATYAVAAVTAAVTAS